MKKTLSKIILIIIAVLFVVGIVLGIVLHNNKISVLNIEENVEYYINGESEFLRFGVEGDGNLFEPNEKINVVLECLDEGLSGAKAIVLITSEQTGFNKWGYVSFDYNSPYNILSFASQENGIFTIKIKQFGKDEHSFTVGVLPENEQASDDFYYGIQPYITRAYTWGEGFQLPNYTA